MHIVLLLSVGSARTAASLVQIGAVSLACGEGPARRACRFRRQTAERDADSRLGFHVGEPLHGIADAARRHRGMERGTTGEARHPRLHDRHRPCSRATGDRLMDGIHDMGGMDGFGKVEPEPNEPPFHEPWEGRVLAMQRAMSYAGGWYIDMSRYAQARLPPPVYLTATYYQRWALAMERNVIERGLADAAELAAGHALRPGKSLKRKLTPAIVGEGMTRGSFYRQAQGPASFKAGDRVRAKNIHPPTHTRLPRYV